MTFLETMASLGACREMRIVRTEEAMREYAANTAASSIPEQYRGMWYMNGNSLPEEFGSIDEFDFDAAERVVTRS